MGFKAIDERAATAATEEEAALPVIPTEIQQDMIDAAIVVSDEVPAEPELVRDRDDPPMEVGTKYPSMNEFRMAVKQHAIVHEFELETKKSDKDRFRGRCSAIGCPWKIRAKTQADKTIRVQINKDEHLCASRSRVLGKMASQAWVAERVIPFLKKNKGIGAKELQGKLQETYKITIGYQTTWYGMQRAKDKLFGKFDDSFDWLYRFKAQIGMRSPGSVVEIDIVRVEDRVHFNRFFCAFKVCIDGFLEGCRPYISIDSTSLNGMWNGHMPAANAIDGHNWMFPLAFGLFDSETKDNWVWFMEQLESWNAWIKDLKDLLINALADAIRERTLILFEKSRRISIALNGVILPAVIHQLNAASKGLDHLKVTKGDPYQTEVTEVHNDEELTRHVVYLDKCTCTCREWQVTGKPCQHALAVITTVRQPNMDKYVDKAFSVLKFQAAYASSIPNITDKKQWPQVEKEFKLLPPVSKKRKVGRQRKNRIPSTLEKGKGKATRQIKCPECGFFGHRKGSARCELTGTKKGKRNQKTTTKVGRKKAKCVSDEQVSTSRTRAAAPREEATETQGQPSQTSSPGPVTRRRLAFEIGQNTQVTPAIVEPPRKLTPRKKLANKKKSATPYKLLN